MKAGGGRLVRSDGRDIRLTSLDKTYYPKTGTTKGEVVRYYTQIAPFLLPHISGRPLNLKRYPEGVEGPMFYQKSCPDHRPEWLPTVDVPHSDRPGETRHCTVETLADLLWLVNLGDLEVHPLPWKRGAFARPTHVVFDLDPGPGASLSACCRVALLLRRVLSDLGLPSYAKTSGGKGVHVLAPVGGGPSSETTSRFARTAAQALERVMPDAVTSNMRKELRPGKVFVDWSQNAAHKSTVAPYSLRARDRPSVSTPITWDEVESGLERPERLVFGPDAVVERVERHGDLMTGVLEPGPPLPEWARRGV
ncbi:MAG: non-homologous end-joining DNA ligase [Euryarchaeota archaeon]|nr:non-homologous end-joining DNA ligase [Euryarchaeota archaeon]